MILMNTSIMQLVLLGFLISAVVGAPNINTVDSPVLSSSDVKYDCVFENLWTRERHPRRYPIHAVHWTRQILASHSSTYNMWREGSMANEGVKKMAEAGGTADIVKELESLDNSYEVGYAQYTNDPTMHFNNPVSLTSKNHYLSVITKMNPSPDWFSGFHDFDALNNITQTWYKEFTIETYPYDAGIEDGISYITANSPTIPAQPISQFTINNVPNSGVFMNQEAIDILPVSKYTCTLNTYSLSDMGIETVSSTILSSQDVQYKCSFENQWNKDRHPNEIPVNSLAFRWTKQILASHGISYTMWREGSMASKAVETLAEAGGIADILEELQELGESHDIGYDKYLHAKDPIVHFEPLEMTATKCYISAISKLSPSPDWFSGFHDFNAVDETSNTWYEEIVVPVFPFDAGTMIGNTYVTFPFPEKNPDPISQFTVENVPESGIFLNDVGNKILPVGTYTCKIHKGNKRLRLNIHIIVVIAIAISGTGFVFFMP